jgi:hypothetical protein
MCTCRRHGSIRHSVRREIFRIKDANWQADNVTIVEKRHQRVDPVVHISSALMGYCFAGFRTGPPQPASNHRLPLSPSHHAGGSSDGRRIRVIKITSFSVTKLARRMRAEASGNVDAQTSTGRSVTMKRLRTG